MAEVRAKLIDGQNVRINGPPQRGEVPVSYWNSSIHEYQHVQVPSSHIVSVYTTPVPPSTPPRYKKGGKIPKAGLYKLHKGEVVVPAHRVKTVDKALRKDGKKPLKKVCKNCVLTKKQLTARRVSSTRARR